MPRSLIAAAIVFVCASSARAQDFSVLRLNEIIAENSTEGPADVAGGSTDLIEILNTGDEILVLGRSDPKASIALSDTFALPETSLWTFRDGVRLLPGDSLLVFCDGNSCQDECEPHASFQIDSNGSEPITIWGPEVDGVRAVIDQVWLPPLRSNVSFGRRTDGVGPAPVPIAETFEYFGFFPPGSTSFGSCFSLPRTSCGSSCGPFERRFCEGRENTAPGNLEPRVTLVASSTHHPAAGEAVRLVAEVRDDDEPTPGNIAKVEIVYRVDSGEERTAVMTWDAATGVLPDLDGLAPGDPGFPALPLDRRTRWVGEIPGQPAGARIEFLLRVEDSEGLASTRPRAPCPPGEGPCDTDFGSPELGAECEHDPDSTSCEGTLGGVRYFPCDAWFSFLSGYEPPEELRGLVINEIVASQGSVLRDPSSVPSSPFCARANPPDYCCLPEDDVPPPPDCGFEDFIELYNAGDVPAPLGGLWLSDRLFEPRRWQFPPGAVLPPGEYAIVWLDGDGGRCPNPDLPIAERPCFWDCPDPNDLETQTYHASFSIDADGESITIFDARERGFGVLHGTDFVNLPFDSSASLCPNGDRDGVFLVTDLPTPRAANPGTDCEGNDEDDFRRGDASADCGVDITDGVFVLNHLFLGGAAPPCVDAADANDSGGLDLTDAIFILNYLFTGGATPPAPGPTTAGADPTEDGLEPCRYPACDGA